VRHGLQWSKFFPLVQIFTKKVARFGKNKLKYPRSRKFYKTFQFFELLYNLYKKVITCSMYNDKYLPIQGF